MDRALMAVADGMNPYKRRRVDPAIPGTMTNPLFPPVAFDELAVGGSGGESAEEGQDKSESNEEAENFDGQEEDAVMAMEESPAAAAAAAGGAGDTASEGDEGEDDELKGVDAPRDSLSSASPSSSRSVSPTLCMIGSISGALPRQHEGRRTPEAPGHRQPLSSPSSALRSRRNLAKASK